MKREVLADWRDHRSAYMLRGPVDLKAGRNVEHGDQVVSWVRYKVFSWDLDNSMSVAYVPDKRAFPNRSEESELFWRWERLEPDWYLVEGT